MRIIARLRITPLSCAFAKMKGVECAPALAGAYAHQQMLWVDLLKRVSPVYDHAAQLPIIKTAFEWPIIK